MFLRHEGYLGAIGAFLKGVEEEGKSFLIHLVNSEYFKEEPAVTLGGCFIKR